MKAIRRIRDYFNTLHGRILLGGLAIHALLIPMLFVGVIYLVKGGFESTFVDRARADAQILATLIETTESTDVITRLYDEVMASKRYVYLDLVTESQNSADGDFKEDTYFGQHGDNTYFVTVPLKWEPGHTENLLLRLGYDETPIVEKIHYTKVLCFYLAGAYVILVFVASGLFTPLITRPMRQLQLKAREIAAGNYDDHFDIGNSRIQEIVSLTNDFEKMRQELVGHNKELEYQSLHDALTKLPNRVLLQDRLNQAIYSAQREDSQLALLMIDLDGFKTVNDTLGHHYGDILLKQVASRIQGVLRKSDTIARFGGDEFCIILPTISNVRYATEIAGKLTECLEQPFIFDNQPYNVGMSIGIAIYPQHGLDAPVLMRHADVAMYIAKNNNLDYTVYDPSQDKNSISRLSLMWDLRHAINHGELHLDYQPIMDFHTGTILAAEALVRWNHPRRGLIMPGEFIALTEQANLIKPLTTWVLEEAARDCSQWLKQGYDLNVSVNLSSRSLHDKQHPKRLMRIIEEHSLPPERLIIELTESAIISDPISAREILEGFHEVGVTLAIDDFGTGYSSLSALRKLPLQIIKIDKSFIMEMLANRDDLVIVRSTIDLAHNMGLKVVGEGVVNQEIWKELKELDCDMAQGFHIGRPMSAPRLLHWIDNMDKREVG